VGFRGEIVPRNDPRIARFTLIGASGEQPMQGMLGDDPAGLADVRDAGLQIIGYESRPSTVDLTPEKVAIYIQEEGLEPFLAHDPKKGIRDHFARCAKAILLTDDPGASPAGYDRRLGFPLELIPEANPYRLAKGARLPVLLLRDGKPLPGALVVAMERDAPQESVRARTDAKGRVLLPLGHPGMWLVKAVHITQVPGTANEWASYWASLTFEARP
jgi:hypothetical protein